MMRLCVLLCTVVFLAGCASDSDRAQWGEVWKDLRGDNMKMRNNLSADK